MNGKALFNGIKLSELDASDMMDVLHFLLEEDLHSSNSNTAEVKSSTRTRIYREFYGHEYRYATKSSTSQNSGTAPSGPESETSYIDEADGFGKIDVFNPRDSSTKPYIPATEFDEASSDPYAGMLDPPMR